MSARKSPMEMHALGSCEDYFDITGCILCVRRTALQERILAGSAAFCGIELASSHTWRAYKGMPLSACS